MDIHQSNGRVPEPQVIRKHIRILSAEQNDAPECILETKPVEGLDHLQIMFQALHDLIEKGVDVEDLVGCTVETYRTGRSMVPWTIHESEIPALKSVESNVRAGLKPADPNFEAKVREVLRLSRSD